MNKEFLTKLYENIESDIKFYQERLFNDEGRIQDCYLERLKQYVFIKRLIDSVIKPLTGLIPEKEAKDE